MKNEFYRPQFYDHEIVDDDGKKVGTIRVKPSGVLWAKAGSHDWKGVTLEEFAEYM
jgi:hypothetical protein